MVLSRAVVGIAIVGVVDALPRQVAEKLKKQFLTLVGMTD